MVGKLSIYHSVSVFDFQVGCGHGLPGIFALLEVRLWLPVFALESLTLKNIMMYFFWLLKGAAAVHFQDFNAEVLRCLTIPNSNANLSQKSHPSSSNLTDCDSAEVRFFAGDWSEIDKLLPHVGTDVEPNQSAGYDFILMAETVYSINSLQNLYNLIKKVFLLFMILILIHS